MTRQRKWQLKKQAEGKCILCGDKAVQCVTKEQLSQYCKEHFKMQRVYTRELLRKTKGATKRYWGAKSYEGKGEQTK